jgi:hypothetical protein
MGWNVVPLGHEDIGGIERLIAIAAQHERRAVREHFELNLPDKVLHGWTA